MDNYYPTTPFRITRKNPVSISAVIHSDITGYEREVIELAVNVFDYIVPDNISLTGKGFADLIIEHNSSPQAAEMARVLRRF